MPPPLPRSIARLCTLSASRRRRRQLRRALTALPASEREIYLLHRVDGLALPSIAARLGLPLVEVETRLVAALVKLARQLDR